MSSLFYAVVLLAIEQLLSSVVLVLSPDWNWRMNVAAWIKLVIVLVACGLLIRYAMEHV